MWQSFYDIIMKLGKQHMPDNSSIDVLENDWSIPSNARHNVRVLCDLAGLSLYEKNVITACVEVESNFHILAEHANKNAQGKVVSTDYGIVQVNDLYHIGPDKEFPSVQYVLSNPEACVRWMILMYQRGLLRYWVSYSSKAYLRYMPLTVNN